MSILLAPFAADSRMLANHHTTSGLANMQIAEAFERDTGWTCLGQRFTIQEESVKGSEDNLLRKRAMPLPPPRARYMMLCDEVLRDAKQPKKLSIVGITTQIDWA